MSNYFSNKQVKLLAEAKSSKKYVHLKNENQSLKDIMNLKNLNKMMSIHNYWDQNNFSLVLDKNIIPFRNFSTDGNDFSRLLINNKGKGRDELIIEASTRTAYRKGDWVMIPPYKGSAVSKNVNIELGNSLDFMLYNLKEDPSQKNNLSEINKDKLKEMISSFVKIRGKNFSNIEDLILE